MKFSQKILRIGDFEKLSFFESAILNFFCFIPMKISHKLCVRMDGTQFFYYDGLHLQPKMSVGMIKEHECTSRFFPDHSTSTCVVTVGASYT